MNNRLYSRPTKVILGFHPTDLLGILIMIIPFYITFKEFTYVKGLFLWVTTTVPKTIKPGMVSALCAVAFYVALILRCQLFRIGTFVEGLVSTIRAFLNCWVIASLMTMIVPTESVSSLSLSGFLKNNQSLFLLVGIIMSWVGMRTISGYCWILFIVAAWKNLLVLDKAMGMWGAVYIITFSISLLLQVTNYVKLSDLMQDFKGEVSKYTPIAKENITLAGKDAQNRAKKAASYVMSNSAGAASVRPSFHVSRAGVTRILDHMPRNASENVPSGEARDLLKALDVNNDGVVDEKDIEILRSKQLQKER